LTLNNVNNTSDLNKPISTLTQTALDLKLNAADTSKYTKQTYIDSSLLTKLKISDTAVMLSSRIARDTLSLSNRINLKANTTDVTSGLVLKLNKADTSTLSNRIDLKANASDVTTSLALKANTSDVNTSLGTKVDKVTGKELSTNDYTTTEKTKLAAITGTNTGDQDLSLLATAASVVLKANTTDVTTDLALKASSLELTSGLANKVDKVAGKNLSTNDYSTTEKTKLAAITGTNTGDQDLSLLATTASVVLKANATDVATDLALKENKSNKSTAVDLGGTTPSDVLFPTQKAVKDYVAANNAGGGVADGGITTIKIADAAVTDAKINTVSGSKVVGNITGNAATATKLATARNINGVAFDGTGDITITASAEQLTGTTLKSTVTGSSLTSIGTLGNLTVTAPIIGSVTGNAANVTGTIALANGGSGATTQQTAINALTGSQITGSYLRSDGTNASLATIQAVDVPILNQNTTGNAATATKLAASKNINGIAFDGSGDVTIPAKFTNNVTINLSGSKSLGKYANGATIPTAGKTLDEFLLDLVTESIPPTYVPPTVSISSNQSGSYEIGTTINVTLSNTFTQNNGGSATGTTYFKNSVSLGTGVSTNNHGVLSTSISYSVTVTYGVGTTVLNNNLGTPDATGQIPAGSKSSSLTISPFAYKYWGSSASNSIDDATLRTGTNENSGKAKSSFTIPISGTKYIFYAYPASLGVLSSISVGGFDSFETFTKTTRDVTNASGYTQSYNIYISNNRFSVDVSNIIIN